MYKLNYFMISEYNICLTNLKKYRNDNLRIGYVLIAICFLIGSVHPVFSQQPVTFRNLMVNDGLSHNLVWSIVQDQNGYLWFGTDDGLNKYNGYDFFVYQNTCNDVNGSKKFSVFKVFEDHSGLLWIGTFGKGLHVFDPASRTFEFSFLRSVSQNSISSNIVPDIVQDKSGVYWIATWGGGLNRYDPSTNTFLYFRNKKDSMNCISSDFIRQLHLDNKGNLWIATKKGLNRFDVGKETFTHYCHDPENDNSIRHDYVLAVLEDREGIVWIGLPVGLDRLDLKQGRFQHYVPNPHVSNNSVRSICQDNSGDLWIGTFSGIIRFEKRQNRFRSYCSDNTNIGDFQKGAVYSILQDRSGLIWAGTFREGIRYFNPSPRFSHYRLKHEFVYRGDDCVTAFAEDFSGTLWIGTLKNGLIRYNPKTKKRIETGDIHENQINRLCRSSISALTFDDSGILWIGTSGSGLIRYDILKRELNHYRRESENEYGLSSNKITCSLKSRKGYLWIGTQNGLNRLDLKSGRIECFKNDLRDENTVSSDMISFLYEDRAGDLWIGTAYDGLNKFDPLKNRFIRYRLDRGDPDNISYGMVSCIYESKSGVLWVGTFEGLYKFSKENRKFHRIVVKDNALSEMIYGILEGERNDLWLSTNLGISKFDPVKEILTFHYPVDENLKKGLIGGSLFKTGDGELFFGGSNGFIQFPSDMARAKPYVPPIVVTEIRRFKGNDIQELNFHENKQISIMANETIEIEFSALSFENSRKNEYAYKIEGIHDDWIYLGTIRKVLISVERAGEYLLRIKGSSHDNIWNEKGISAKLLVVSPFRYSWWFYSLLTFGIFISIYFSYTKFKRHQRNKLNRIEKLNELFSKRRLTDREKEVALLLIHGKSNREIEDLLYISINTVKNHVASIFQKILVKNRFQFLTIINEYLNNE